MAENDNLSNWTRVKSNQKTKRKDNPKEKTRKSRSNALIITAKAKFSDAEIQRKVKTDCKLNDLEETAKKQTKAKSKKKTKKIEV